MGPNGPIGVSRNSEFLGIGIDFNIAAEDVLKSFAVPYKKPRLI